MAQHQSPASRFGKIRQVDGETVRDYKSPKDSVSGLRPYVPTKVKQGVRNPQNSH